MRLQGFKDYVFVEKVHMISDSGVFAGTSRYVFCFPSKTIEYSGRKVTTSEMSYQGKEIKDAIKDVISNSESVEVLEQSLLALTNAFEGMSYYDLNEVKWFKVQAGLLGSGIHVVEAGKKLNSPFIQSLGKTKKQIKEFYSNHPKFK